MPARIRAVLTLAAALLIAAAATAQGAQITITSVEGFPNGRTSNDPPANAIDGNTATFTWTTEALSTARPAYLAIGFDSQLVNRLRLFKLPDGGGGQNVKNLSIEFTTGTGPLSSRGWQNVRGLQNGVQGSDIEYMNGQVNARGTVLGDVHSGFASLSFTTLRATGLRVAFANPSAEGTCSSNPTGPCNHYRVGEIQAFYDEATGPAVPPGSLPDQPPINGPPLFRIRGFQGREIAEVYSGVDGAVRRPKQGWFLGRGDSVKVLGIRNIGGGGLIQLEALPSGARFEVAGDPAVFRVEDVPLLEQGGALVTTGGAQAKSREMATGGVALRTPVARVDVDGSVAEVAHDPRRGLTTVGNVRGAVSVTPSNPALRGLRLVPGQQVEVTRSLIGKPFALVPNLQNTIPSPREVRAGPTIVTAPSRLSLRSLRRSKCVAVSVSSARPSRVLVTIFSGRRSVRLFGQRSVVFTAAGRKSTCILVPARARTFDVRTPLSFAVGYALGARARPGERPPAPKITPIALVP